MIVVFATDRLMNRDRDQYARMLEYWGKTDRVIYTT